ncbi:DUF4355 domain-containing protein [Clostridium beijerinckii]|uniref:DUF4355 domain-containing protein n=1 Tax=Clostridium beijerinckii TaxID=1520 RepID=A0AAX0B863_CLOBE|nr:DUF4355 domain-containing protein [Clostridium beijerinckii]NRT91510.1 hypothetical protein [Clostridium beijerinckii]NYC71035.1 hypothetical protein [Clostridium beijerinckii]UYZ34155.1 DUF4355 domain-containing protein [Clostridium beijerinckii]
MLKTELVKLIENLGDQDDVMETLKGIEGLSQTFDATKATIDDYKAMLENNAEVKGYYKSTFDSAVGEAVDSHDKKFNEEKLPKIIEEEIKKRSNEGKTPDQIKLDEALAEIQKIKVEKAQSEMKAKYTKVLSDKGFGTDWLDLIKLSDNEESNDKTIEKLSELYNTAVTKGINSKITENPPIPEKGQGLSKPKDAFVKGLGL